LVAAGAVVLLRIPFFYLRSWWVGGHLARAALTDLKHHRRAAPKAVAAAWPAGVQAVLEIPTIHLVAPVVQGTQDAQLNVAVGHLTTSVEPGQAGTSILAGHNVTWFHHINQLHAGDQIRVLTPHHRWVFQVTQAKVVHVGTPVYNTPYPSLVLEACYPLDALYLTPYRYLVFARLEQSAGSHGAVLSLPENVNYTPVGIPAAVQAQGLTLATNYLPMGKLRIVGTPTVRWRQSNAPLNAASATTTLFLAALHILRDHNPAWWHDLAPSVPYTTMAPLTTGHIAHYDSLADESETVVGDRVTQTTLTVTVQITGGTAPGVYTLIEHTSVSGHNRVRIATIQLET
jgi:sortase A